MEATEVAAALAASYLLGSVPIGWLLIKALRGVDIRRYGSGNIGTINVLRVGGVGLAALVLLLDAAKGFAPVAVLVRLGADPWVAAACGFAAAAGHSWPVFLRFHGGKAVATALGALAAADPSIVVVAVLVWIVVVALTRYASLGSLLGTASTPITASLAAAEPAWIGLSAALAVLVLIRHRSNVVRLLRGEELRVTDRVA